MASMTAASRAGRVIMPALRIDRIGVSESRKEAMGLIERVDPCGFLIFGGALDEVAELTSHLRRTAGRPLLFAADLERGGGQQFQGLAKLPPQMAIAACVDAESLAYEAGRCTARDARRAGVNLVFAPLCDVNTEPRNPIINVRSFSDDPACVARLAVAWIRGAQENGVLACAKHFPGHGATASDSHLTLCEGEVRRELQEEYHSPPFEAACRAGVGSVMTAHMTVPALGERTNPATIAPRIVKGILRDEFRFGGLIVTDALIMAGINMSEEQAGVLALRAGCDILLYPQSPEAVAARIAAMECDLAESIARIDAALARVEGYQFHEKDRCDTDALAARIADQCVTLVRGKIEKPESYLVICDESKFDSGPFRRAMSDRGVKLVSPGVAGSRSETLVVAIYSRPMAWAETIRPHESILKRIPPDCGVISFGDPYFLSDLPSASYAIAAYDDHEEIQRAVVSHLCAGKSPVGRLPIRSN